MVFGFVSCGSRLQLQKSVTIHMDSPLHPFQFGTFYDSLGCEYLYFANLDYSYKINIYDSAYLPIRQINLEIPDGKYYFHGCLVKSIDTILILSKPFENNQLLYFNDSGYCYRIVHLNKDVTTKDNLFNYHLWSNSVCENSNIQDDYLYLFMDFRTSYKDKRPPSHSVEYKKYYYRHRYETPYILKINLNNPEVYTFGGQGLQYTRQLCDTGECIGFSMLTSCADHKLFAWFESSDKLFVCNEEMEVEKEIVIKSRHTSIGRLPYKPEEEINIYEYGRIYNVFYSQEKRLYYIVVRHELSLDDNIYRNYYEGAPFSILVYDEHFKKKGETRIRSGKYDYLYSFMTNEGLCLVKTSKSADYDPHKVTFDVYQTKK